MRIAFAALAILIACANLIFTEVSAAEFRKNSLPDGSGAVIAVVGDLEAGDDKKFVDLALGTQTALVVFESPGGNLIAGIEIGKAVHLKGFGTLVPDGVQCASACALAWPGGRVRFMGETGRVGFHAAYTSSDGRASVSSSGNALVGAYLNQLGLPEPAILYITGAPPDDMQWLSFADALRFGIDVKRAGGESASHTETASAPASPSKQSITAKSMLAIKTATYRYVSEGNRDANLAVSFLDEMYSDQVRYYGKDLPKSYVLAEKRKFFDKWPLRDYSMRPDTLEVSCETDRLCAAQGVLDWTAANTSRVSSGSSTFSLGWARDGVSWRLVFETSKVLSRSVRARSPGEAVSQTPRYQLDASQSRVLSLSNLDPDTSCATGMTVGKVVKRSFAEDGLTLSGFVIEISDGSREFVNVDAPSENLNNVTRGWVSKGLGSLLAEQRSAEIFVKLCGAAGRVQVLDAAR
jgi:hypothetical protein